MAKKKEDVREILRKGCEDALGVKKIRTVTILKKHLEEALGGKAKELCKGQEGESMAVAPQAVLDALGEETPATAAAPVK